MVVKLKILLFNIIIISILIWILLSLFGAFETIQAKSDLLYDNNKQTIIIDAGHGGEDSGAVAYDNTLEKDINLKIALNLSDMLKAVGFDVLMIREDDISIYSEGHTSIKDKKISDMRNRLDIYNSSEDNIVISIHQNMFEDSKYSGTQIFYGAINENSALLAQSVQNSIVGMLQPQNERELKKATSDIFLLHNSSATCIIVECGFLSNTEELSLLKTDDYQKEISFAIMCGILDYYNKME